MRQLDSVNEVKLREIQKNAEKKKSVEYQEKLFGDAVKGNMIKLPQDAVELMSFFCSVEQLFVDFGVENKVRVHLLEPDPTAAARVLIASIKPSAPCGYDKVKAMLLHQLKLGPADRL